MAKCAAEKTVTDRPSILAAVGDAVRDVLGAYPTRACADIIAAQICLETGNGAKMYNWNVGGHKCPNPGPDDDWTEFATAEGYGPTRRMIYPPDPGCRFAAYPSLEAGCEAHVRLLSSSRFAAMLAAAEAGDATAFAQAGHVHGYYTGDPAEYAADVASIVRDLSKLPPPRWQITAQAEDTLPEVDPPPSAA